MASASQSKSATCWRSAVAATVSIRSMKSAPASERVPPLHLRSRTAGRSARSAALWVGSTPSCLTKTQSEGPCR